MGKFNIKNLKPRKNSYYHQSIIDPKTTKKYYDCLKSEPIIARSGLEVNFINYVESNPSVKKWASEPIQIPYFSRLDNKQQNYYPDYVLENKDGNKVIVEVKPYAQTKKPKPTDSAWLKQAWIKNCDKWAAAKAFAEKRNMKFIIVTEKFFE